MEFLATVGTPCILNDTNATRSQDNYNGAEGYFVQISHGSGIKYNAALAAEIEDLDAKMRHTVIS